MREGDWVARDFRFADGEALPELRLHYRTLGTPHRDATGRIDNAALLLHGTTGTGAQFLQASMAGPLFGSDGPLDLTRWFVVLPDGIGAGGSSKPSDGLRARFPRYGYRDQVEAQRRLLQEGLGVAHLRLVLGTSMGGMQAWLWAGLHPDMMDAVVPIACQPAPVSGRNMLWREMLLRAIVTDPGWQDGTYDAPPTRWAEAWPLFRIMTDSAGALQEAAPTRAGAEALFGQLAAEGRARDAADTYYVFDSSRDYDPEPLLPRITARLLAINFTDDLLNPPELGAVERAVARLPRAAAVLVPAGSRSHGHQNLAHAEIWAGHLARFLADDGGRARP